MTQLNEIVRSGSAGLQASVNAEPKDRGASAPELLAPAEAGSRPNGNAA
jgi:hypothetical protein